MFLNPSDFNLPNRFQFNLNEYLTEFNEYEIFSRINNTEKIYKDKLIKNSFNITIEPYLSKLDLNIFEIKDKYIKLNLEIGIL